ncbi:hypothetical protein AWV79_06760 [Cupriavidus sp. UYMMa02A]|nr:hypothetical protein AWV79_06760 [Cupriavidus sp. UYMMa02A]
MFDRTLMRKLEDLENPRIVELSDDLYGASFSLMKLLPARFMLERAVEEGLLRPGATICESSSGTFGLALAMLAVQYGYNLVLVSDLTLDRHLRKRSSNSAYTWILSTSPRAMVDFSRRG